MKKLLTTAALSLIALSALAQKPAFPTAEGFGRYTTGGRGGKVVHVTNLNDKGTGSLREAVKGNDKKIVVFDVSGVIALDSDLSIGSNTTIMGQTAPGQGITVRYYTTTLGSNVIIRYMRFRRGEEKNVNDGADAIWTRHQSNIILDHCSFSWSIDETASFYDNRDFTMQWCTVGESLNNAGHGKGAHGYGGIWGGKNASFHHNLLIGHTNRSPRFNGARYSWDGYDKNLYPNTVQAERVDFRNCVNYNWGTGGCYGGPGGGYVNMVNNYYKAGPATTYKTRVTTVSINSSSVGDSSHPELYNLTSRYYINGNYVAAAGSPENYDWQGVAYDGGIGGSGMNRTCVDANDFYGLGKGASVPIRLEEPIDAGTVTTHSAEVAYEKVIYYAGASLEKDMVDNRYESEVTLGEALYKGSVTKKAGILDYVSDQGDYSVPYKTRPASYDTDKDGMPDEWEEENGLNPNNAADAALYTLDPAKYYTNVEVFCNSLVQELVLDQVADGDDAVADYFPAYRNEFGVLVPAVNMPEIGGKIPEGGLPGTITWTLKDGKIQAAAEVSDEIAEYISDTDMTVGSDYTISGTKALDGITFSVVSCGNKNSSASSANLLDFSFTVADGYMFQPTEVGMKASRYGTDGGKFDLAWLNTEGTKTLASSVVYNRNNATPPYTDYSNTNFQEVYASEGTQHLLANFYTINAGKGFFLCDVYVKGAIVETGNAVETIEKEEAKTYTYYNIQGMRLPTRPQSGAYIRVATDSKGRSIATKHIAR